MAEDESASAAGRPKTPEEWAQWQGALHGQNRRYEFYVYQLPWTPELRTKGVYIFTRRDGDRWLPIYIGQGNLQRGVRKGQSDRCIQQKGATHVHVYRTRRYFEGDLRRSILSDLLTHNVEAYIQKGGCNVAVIAAGGGGSP